MSSNSISSGGIAPDLKDLAAEPTPRHRTGTAPAQAVQRPESAAAPRLDSSPTAEELSLLNADDLRGLVADMNQALAAAGKPPLQVDFRPDERNNGFVIEIRTESGDLVRQFPPELILNLRRKLDELSGMVVDHVV